MKKLKPQKVDWAQIERFLQSAERKLASAHKILAFDEEACLQQAYEAMLKASLGFMFSHGFRARSQPGHHIAIIEFVRARIDKRYLRYVDRNKTYSLRDSEIHTLMELGTFRVIAETDLAELGYAKDRSRMEHDIENLQKQGLVQQRTIEETDYPTTRVLALTKQGHRLLSRGNLLPRDQPTYHGFAKPKEARHDADLYRLYYKVAREIESKGGHLIRVKLDYELKRKLYHDLERTARDKDMETAKKEVAERHHLKVVHGKIAVPDMRIEYVQDDMMIQRRDLELATDHYRPRGLAAKARAGFQIYARRADVDRLRRIRDDRELSAAIFSL